MHLSSFGFRVFPSIISEEAKVMKNISGSAYLALLVFAGAACSFNIGGSGAEIASNDSNVPEASRTDTSEIPGPDAADGTVPVVEKKTLKRRIEGKKIVVDAEYPRISGVVGADDFNEAVEAEVTRRIEEFTASMPDPEPEERERSIYIRYENAFIDSEVASFLMLDSEDAGGAHPNTTSFVINYDLRALRSISLKQVFKAGTPYLRKLSEYCRPAVKKKLEEIDAGTDWLEEGTAPTEENFRSWVVTEKGIKITFDAYQVAAYAYGPQEVVIPYAVLRDFLEPDSPISRLAGL